MLCGLAAPSRAQEAPFPQKGAIEITVLFPAGSSADVTARLLADGMAKQLGASVIVVNRPGAGGAIGYRHVAARKPDGYSLVWNSNSISTAYHSGLLAFDYRAFDPIPRCPTCRPRRSRVSTFRSKPGAASRRPGARPNRSSPRSKRQFAEPWRAPDLPLRARSSA